MIRLRKIRLYLDSSVVGEFEPADKRREMTREFFRYIEENPEGYELVVSPVLLRELTEAPDDKRKIIFDFLDKIPHNEIPANQDAGDLVKLYVQENVLSEKHKDDLEHVAYAVVSHCDYIVSWNMKHIVKERTMSRVNAVNLLNHYPVVSFITPQFFTGDTSDVSD